MKKNELMTSDVVLSSKGSYGVVLKDTPEGDLIKWFKNANGETIVKYRSLFMIDEDMKFLHDLDNRIIKVYRPTDKHDVNTENSIKDEYLIYEEKVKEVTIKELEKMYGCKVKIVD